MSDLGNKERASISNNAGNTRAAKRLSWVFAGVAMVVVALALYFGLQTQKYQELSVGLSAELDDTRVRMKEDLAVVQSAYDTQRLRTEELSAEVQQKFREIEDLRNKISATGEQLLASRADAAQIKERLAQMEILKAQLEADLLSLQKANDSLEETSTDLALALDRSRLKVEQMSTEIADLNARNEALDRRLSALAPAGFRADNFRISIEKRNDKLTAKARRADEITVQFDLDNVPEDKQGVRSLYLAVTKPDGSPVRSIPTMDITVPGVNEPLQIRAVATEELELQDAQTIAMAIPSNRDFPPGEYNIFVYSEMGYLGASGFKLR